jgi:hypothetical protein
MNRLPVWPLLMLGALASPAFAQGQVILLYPSSPTPPPNSAALAQPMEAPDMGAPGMEAESACGPVVYVDAAPVQAGTEVEIRQVPIPEQRWAPAPAFADLDTDGNGSIDEHEASAYPPLANDFLYASHGKARVTAADYRRWAQPHQEH